jgi:hypothetical protein
MKQILKFSRIFWIGISILTITIAFLPSDTSPQMNHPEIVDLPPLDDTPREGHPKMEYVLYQLLKTYVNQGIEEARKFAELRGIDMERDLVRVVAEAKPYRINMPQKKGSVTDIVIEEEFKTSVNILSMQIEALGGIVETTYKQLVQNKLPVDSLLHLADSHSTKYLRLPYKPILLETSEGVAKTGANQWHNLLPYHSEGAKVCILDAGFKGYESLLGSELPSSVVTRSFRADNDIEANCEHGTACAEIVYDMAPNAQLWLVNYGTDVEMATAVDWIIAEGIEIISNSTGSYLWGAGDGTGIVCAVVQKATNRGIIWINAAGNQAEDHWMGTFRDNDGDGWHNFSVNDELLQFYAPAYQQIKIDLRWNDWGEWTGSNYIGSRQNFDLYLYYWNGTTYVQTVFNSKNLQSGSQKPIECIFIPDWINTAPGYWGIAIKKISANRNVSFDLYVTDLGPIQYNIPERSIVTPADSIHSITVGAVHWSNDVLESYSSQGPTSDGRIKPDICAPSVVTTASYGTEGFNGTSAACPHVAGAFALLKSMTPQTFDQIKATLEALAIDLGPAGKDNKFGIGRLNLVK